MSRFPARSDEHRRQLAGERAQGPHAQSDMAAFDSILRSEYPALASAPGLDRRSLLRIMGASLALAGLSGCTPEAEEAALPYVNQPEFVLPGQPRWYATAVTFCGPAQPVLAKTHVGRPVKLEGNRDHPLTGGGTDPFLQAALLGLYDPDRSQGPRRDGRPTNWASSEAALTELVQQLDAVQGEGFRLLTGATTSATFARQLAALSARWPRARWHVWEPCAASGRDAAILAVLGSRLVPHFMLHDAEALVCLDDDPLGPGPQQAVLAARWGERRRAMQRGQGGCSLLVAEAAPTLTGTMAERRLVAPPQRINTLARAIARDVGIPDIAVPALSSEEQQWVDRSVATLRSHGGRSLLTVGDRQDVETQILGLMICDRLGAIGKTLRFRQPVTVEPPGGSEAFGRLVEDMRAGAVSSIAIIGSNPVYTASDAGFAEALAKVPWRLHAGTHRDETARRCQWHLPLAHELESWSDARAADGTASIIQPLIRPLYDTRGLHSLIEILLRSPAAPDRSDREIVAATWRAAWGDGFEARWQDALTRGFVVDSAAKFMSATPVRPAIAAPSDKPATGLTVLFEPDATVWDGRFSGNAWLQETPKPLTKVTWENTIGVSPQWAEAHGVSNGDEVELTVAGDAVCGPAWIMPGQERDTVVVSFGYGRQATGSIADGLGYDAFVLRRPDRPWRADGATLTRTGRQRQVACTQRHQKMDGFDFVRTVSQGAGVDDLIPAASRHETESFYPTRSWDSPSWGMAIDLDACIGCNACAVACVAENNVAVVGKDLVAEGREMHWLRIDRYHEGKAETPRMHFQPVPCMHCEQAPCEMGCPVNAAVHSSDGLNLQVYNRCIGTRTCSSYCPYKVRRFNWFDYTAADPPQMQAIRNPDVTVRMRGVMEKCTYCVQRISEARITAKKEDRAIREGEVVTACQQTCPTQAISFGDVTDPNSAVSRRKAEGRNYTLLEEANTRPRTSYLARIDTAADPEGGKK